jgi:chromosome segregation ATPase
VPVEPGKTATFTVAEEFPRATVVALTGRNTSETRLYLQQPGMSDALKAALQKLVQMQDELATLTEQRSQKEARIKEIGQEQERIRQNMRELDRASELYKQYVEKFTKQEAEFEALRTEIKDLTAKETAKQDEIANYVAGLDIQ